MNLLLDTQIFLWFISADPRLPASMQAAIQDSANSVFLSAASVWEATVKYQLGKLLLPESPEKYLTRQREAHLIASLAIDEQCIGRLVGLPEIHKDPFDRILVCQALQHDLVLMTSDDIVRRYPAQTFKGS